MKRTWTGLLVGLILLVGCATVGREFPAPLVQNIRIGETEREDIRRMFGEPWRTGIEDGNPTWTYAHYHYSVFGPERVRDLLIRFDEDGKVASYSFNTSYPEYRQK